jgi:hypothetical protein
MMLLADKLEKNQGLNHHLYHQFPLGITVDAANRHDMMKMTKAILLQSIMVHRPEPTIRLKQHMCMDKDYDFPKVHELLEDYGYYTIHIRL